MENEHKEKNGKFNHLVTYCLGLHKDIGNSAYRKKAITQINKSIQAYDQVKKKSTDPWPGASSIELPLTTISNDNLAPRLASGLIGKQPYVRFEMESDQTQDDKTKVAETWFNQELEDVVEIESLGIGIVEKVLKEGTIYPMPRYDLDEEVRKDFMFVSDELSDDQKAGLTAMSVDGKEPENIGGVWVGADGPLLKETTEATFEGCRVDLVPFKDIYIPDDVDDWEKAPVLRKVYPTYGELLDDKEKKKGYRNIGKWLLKDRGEGRLTEDQRSEDQKLSDVMVSTKEVIECIECYVRYAYQEEDQDAEDKNSWHEERLIAQIALDSKVLIRLIPLREINFKNQHLIKRIAMFRRQGRSYGEPLHSKIAAIQEGASKTFNMSINIAEIVMIPWFLYTDKLGIKGKNTKLKPGFGLKVDDIQNGVYFPRFNINPSQMFQYIEVWMGFWERVTSIGNSQMGLPDAKKTTATEVLAVIQEGNIKHNYQARPLRKDFIGLIRTIYDLYYQHMPLEKQFLYNKTYVPIPRSELRRPFKFRLTGSTEMANKLIERREKEDIYRNAMSEPFGVFDPIEITKRYLEASGETDTEDLLNPLLNKIAKLMKEVPQTEQAFEQALQGAMQMVEGQAGK